MKQGSPSSLLDTQCKLLFQRKKKAHSRFCVSLFEAVCTFYDVCPSSSVVKSDLMLDDMLFSMLSPLEAVVGAEHFS